MWPYLKSTGLSTYSVFMNINSEKKAVGGVVVFFYPLNVVLTVSSPILGLDLTFSTAKSENASNTYLSKK